MSGREFNKVSPAIWDSRRFRRLSVPAKFLLIYAMTCERQNSAGCFELRWDYAQNDTGLSEAQLSDALTEIIAAGLVDMDAETDELFVDQWFQHNRPQNEKHAIGTARIIASIKSDAIRERVEEQFDDARTKAPSPPTPGTNLSDALQRLSARR